MAIRRILRFVADVLTTCHVLVAFVLIESAIRWCPLSRLVRLVGCRLELSATNTTTAPPPVLSGRGVRELRAVRRVARRWPVGPGPCLRTSLVAGHMLRRYRPSIRLGTIGSGAALSAHAWIEIDGRPLQPVDRYRPFHPGDG